MGASTTGKQNAVFTPLVLIVEDEPGLLRLFSNLVERLDCRTLQAEGGTMALDILDQQTPDLLILDLAMPDVSGTDVLRYVRSIPRLDRMQVMIFTARPNMIADIEDMGIDRWVSKPINPRDFLDVVEEMLANAQDEDPA
jgi:CheY-like chemotaxis protein